MHLLSVYKTAFGLTVMARPFGSTDSYKRNTVNYKGRVIGAKDLFRRDGYKVWLHYQDKSFAGYGKKLNPEYADLWWRGEYLYEVLRIKRSCRRYRFAALSPAMEISYSSMLAEIEDKFKGVDYWQIWTGNRIIPENDTN